MKHSNFLKQKIETTRNDICNLRNGFYFQETLKEYNWGDKRRTELEEEYENLLYLKEDFLKKLIKLTKK
jgi:hypothetical protein